MRHSGHLVHHSNRGHARRVGHLVHHHHPMTKEARAKISAALKGKHHPRKKKA